MKPEIVWLRRWVAPQYGADGLFSDDKDQDFPIPAITLEALEEKVEELKNINASEDCQAVLDDLLDDFNQAAGRESE